MRRTCDVFSGFFGILWDVFLESETIYEVGISHETLGFSIIATGIFQYKLGFSTINWDFPL